MRLINEPRRRVAINIVPLIDVMFALLTFFVISTLYLTRSEGLPVNLPKAATAQQQQVTTKITITVDDKKQISLNRKPVSINNLTQQVRALVGSNSEALVVINADEKVDYGEVVKVMDQVRQVQGTKLAIGTQKP
ncbi:MAG: biopolymer transporter ExbD [Nostoc sp.]|uniref:ExbD/TolR family protein n=1 Tax=Nostoc sp. TaxID=1180 RepID=UPI002FF5FA6D